jgi:tetratricopeptide (TPR) repeat protein
MRANVARARGDLATAWALYEQCLAIDQRLEDRLEQAVVLHIMSTMSLDQGESERARSLAEEALARSQQEGFVWGIGRALYDLGRVAQHRGDDTTAQGLLREAITRQRQLADQQGLTWSLMALAHTSLSQDDAVSARELLGEALQLARRAAGTEGVVRGLEGVACLVAPDRSAEAVRLGAAAQALRRSLGTAAAPHEQQRLNHCLAVARGALDPDAYAAAWADGASLSIEQAITRALDVVTPAVGIEAPGVRMETPRLRPPPHGDAQTSDVVS